MVKFKLLGKSLVLPVLVSIILLGILIITVISVTGIKKYHYRKNLEKSLSMAGEWFLKNQKEEGNFYYQRSVDYGTENERDNIVRQAYSAYTLSLLYKHTGDPAIGESLKKSFYFFRRIAQSGTANINGSELPTFRITYRGDDSNNSSALILLALINYLEKNPGEKYHYTPFMKGLANYLVTTQLPSGGFMYKLDPNQEEDHFNNGETFYAMARYYSYSREQIYMETAKKAADYFIQKYRHQDLNMSFFGWGLQGFYYLYLEVPEERYWEAIKQHSQAYLDNAGRRHLEFYNQTGSIAPPASLAVLIEGLAHTAELASRKDPEFYRVTKNYIDRSVLYLQQFQINGPMSKRTSEHEKVQGGICMDYYCQTEQIDVTGHHLAALYFYLTFFK
jgi:hypothetical protein